ncbi:MAG TPA: alkaline phosphatase family protein [Candidatus Angelobacter sp.]|nr:alkaline phosphatase family protein [Candidatus Angelobacter sp.]
MTNPNRLSLVSCFVALLALGLCAGCAGITTATSEDSTRQPTATPTPTPPATINSVNHVIVMLQENRSFDSYFGKMTAYRAANGIPGTVEDLDAGKFSNSGIAPYHSGSVCMENLSPDWAEDHHDVNLHRPKSIDPRDTKTMPMDGFVSTAAGIAKAENFIDTSGHRAMGFYTEHELNYYYFMASNFAMSDAFYSPNPTNTANNRMYALAATSQGTVHTPGGAESCPGARIQATSKTIFQLLSEHNISWKIYITDLLPTCDPKNGTFPLACAVHSTYLQFFTYINGASAKPPVAGVNPEVMKHMAPLDCSGATSINPKAHKPYVCPQGVTDFFTDLAKGTLPSVAFIETGAFSGRDEHPSGNNGGTQIVINIQAGAKFVSEVMNPFMASPAWKDSVFFWFTDEGGGAFDHVPPIGVLNPDGVKPILCLAKDLNVGGDFNITGFRVPNFIVSPFSRKNFVSHTPMDYTAWLKFVETRWNLPSLTLRDAAMPDMQEFFDFSGVPWATPPTPPKQVTTGTPCDFTKQ